MKPFLLFLFILLSLPGLAQEDDEALVDELQENKQKQAEQMQKLLLKPEKKETEASSPLVPEEIQKLGYKEINIAALSDERVVKALQKMLSTSPLRHVPAESIKSLILEESKGSLLETVFDMFPGALDCLVALIKDEKALPSALGIFLRKGDLKLYFVIWLLFMVMSWLIKRILFNDDTGRWTRNFGGLFVSLFITSMCLFSFYKIFEKELSPAVSIILSTATRFQHTSL